jgi:hypothetical protein
MKENWFETKITYDKTMENGQEKKVTESNLVNAVSFSEAEERIIREMTPYISGEFTVSGIQRAKYSEVHQSPSARADKWYKCKLMFIALDEKSGAEKKTASCMLVQGENIKDAMERVTQIMGGSVADYEQVSITETAILDVYL